jgi:hypothetical protein
MLEIQNERQEPKQYFDCDNLGKYVSSGTVYRDNGTHGNRDEKPDCNTSGDSYSSLFVMLGREESRVLQCPQS